MKFRDFVVNSLPRVRGKKKARAVNPSTDTPNERRNESRPGQPSRLSSLSRESSVERASHVAVADATWRQTPPRTMHDEVALVGAMAYYGPPPGMVISHSAEGISSHSLAILPSRYSPLDYNGPYSQMTAISENAVNYAMPRGFMFQSQHHHRHNHQHDHHYIYHHHHHHEYPSDHPSRAPLAENNRQHPSNHCKTTSASRKSEPGFLRKSFASFKALRKQRSNGKEQVAVSKPKAGDENGKCSVCPYPQLHAIGADPKKNPDTRPAKPKRKGLKSLRKSKQNHEDQMDKTWFSDNDACSASGYQASDVDLFYHTSTARPRFRECSVESCMSRLYGSQEGTYGPETESRGLDSNSLSGYESDLPKTKSGRTRSRIKTNPWLPSPQPSLNIGRRFAQCDFQESHEDVMTVDEDLPTMPRSASFEHQRPTTLSSFQASSKGKSIQRHRSLTPSDLKITLSVHKGHTEDQTSSSELAAPHNLNENNHLNDLNVTVPKLRPSSILSPASEFVILTDNIEQLANNISFEYEDMLDTTLESVSTCQEDGKVSIQELLTDEELSGNGENKDNVYSNINHDTTNAHSPDSGIGCLGSSDADDLAMANAPSNEQSSISSSNTSVTTSSESRPQMTPKKESKSCHITDVTSTPQSNIPVNWLEPQIDIRNQSARCFFVSHSSAAISPFAQPLSNAECLITEMSSSSKTSLINEDTQLCDNNDVNYTESSSKGILKERTSDIVPETHANEDVKNSAEGLPNSLDTFSNSLANDQCPSSTVYEKCFGSENMNNFQEKASTSDSPKTQIQAQGTEANILPPNIIRSEFVTPLESPTENWQCDETFLLQFQNPKLEQDREISEDCTRMEGRNEEKYEKMSTKSERIDKTQLDGKSGHQNVETLVGGAADRTDGTTETNCIDWADASVQTDFNEEELDSWPVDDSHPLNDLCDEEFDPIESTRRWLLTGNMQGSADTGYSSQPRDSQILMEDDELIGSDNINISKTNLSKCPLSGRDETMYHLLSDSTKVKEAKEDQDAPSGEDNGVNEVEDKDLKNPDGKIKTQSDDIVKIMFSGIESQFQDIFNQLWPAQVLPEMSGSKRDSSGSSTSTLISESVDGVQELMPYDQSTFDADTPRNSGCAEAPISKLDKNVHQNVVQKTAPKKIKTTYPLEPDYVNVPRKGRHSKSNGGHGHWAPETGNKEYSVSFKKCSVRNYPYLEGHANICGPGFSWSNSQYAMKNKSNDGSTERADYLEFLRDAPLGNVQNKRSMFLLPGFGPIDMSSMANNDWTIVPECQGYICSKQSTDASDFDSVALRKTQSRNKESNCGAKPKCLHKKEHRDKTFTSSVDKRHSHENDKPRTGDKVLPEKPKRKNPRAIQIQPSPMRTEWKYSQLSGQRDQADLRHPGTSVHGPRASLHHTRSHKDSSTRSIAERVRQLQREKDVIYSQLREVQQEELSRQRLQLQQQRNIHSQRKDILLETLRELKENLEEQSRQLSLKCNKDVYI